MGPIKYNKIESAKSDNTEPVKCNDIEPVDEMIQS